MNCNNVGPGLGEALDLSLRGIDHQVNVQWQGGAGANRLHHPVADAYSGHKLPVHDINMDIVGACPGNLDNLLAQTGEIGREDRGS
ncbi:MAG: hypothetical protein DDT26_02184 [Dehalococcoidia bacterium]|nr:hypothetical protein [Chloroflexota bacterium]